MLIYDRTSLFVNKLEPLVYGQSKDFVARQILWAAGIYNVENIASLDRVPLRIALSMKNQRRNRSTRADRCEGA
jgi:hypothetical protein